MLDAARSTSVAWTYFMMGDYDTAIEIYGGRPPFCAVMSRLITGQMTTEALQQEALGAGSPGTRLGTAAYRAILDSDIDAGLKVLEELGASGFDEPQCWYLYGFCFARMGAASPALQYLGRAINGGYGCHEQLITRPDWASLRNDSTFIHLLDRARALVDAARARFEALDGMNVLSAKAAPSSRG